MASPFSDLNGENGEVEFAIARREPIARAVIRRPTIAIVPPKPTRRVKRALLPPPRAVDMKFDVEGGRPGDKRAFVHKKLLGGFSKVAGLVSSVVPLPGLGIAGELAGSFARGRGRGRTLVPRTLTARVSRFSEAEKQGGRAAKFPELSVGGFGPKGDDGCIIPGMRRDPGTGKCAFFLGERKGPDGGFDVGEAVMGRYGAGLIPGSMVVDRAVCLKGMQLGNDGVCYNKSQITNKQRRWPAGRKPLLSGGDMRAIGVASRAGKRLEGATKRLQRMGMMRKPSRSRRVSPAQHQHLLESHVTK